MPPPVAGLSVPISVSGQARKGPDGQGLRETKEDKMSNVITQAALQGRTLTQLQSLYQAMQQELARSEYGSQERREALASLELLSLAIAQRRIAGPGF